MKVALQVYSVRDVINKENFYDVLKQIKDMGYDGVEFAGLYEHDPKEIKKFLDEIGLEAVSSHVGYDALTTNLDKEIETAKTLGQTYLVCPGASGKSKADWEAVAAKFTEISKKCAENGLKFGYHNHAHEFEKFDGEYALDILYANCTNIVCEIDTYWVKKGNEDPVSYTKKYADRMPIIHAKDLDETGKDMEVGTGCIEFKKIFSNLPKLEWIIIEQEQYNYPVMESVKIGCDNMKNL